MKILTVAFMLLFRLSGHSPKTGISFKIHLKHYVAIPRRFRSYGKQGTLSFLFHIRMCTNIALPIMLTII